MRRLDVLSCGAAAWLGVAAIAYAAISLALTFRAWIAAGG